MLKRRKGEVTAKLTWKKKRHLDILFEAVNVGRPNELFALRGTIKCYELRETLQGN